MEQAKKVRAVRDMVVNGLYIAVILGTLLFLAGSAIWSAVSGDWEAAAFAGIVFAVLALWKLASKQKS